MSDGEGIGDWKEMEIFQAKEVDRVDTVLHTSTFVTCVCIIAQGQ